MQDGGNPDAIKRYTPPRNRAHNRRKSGGDHGDAGCSNIQKEYAHLGLIHLNGCTSSVAREVMTDRWVSAMRSYNSSSVELSERPILYSSASGSTWGHFKLPHQMDFVAELKRKIHEQSSVTPSGEMLSTADSAGGDM